jgi:inner membrane protein involved in colicin E2 resistance
MLQFTRGYKLHYVHYWFTAVSMFSFDLLFANLAGKINIYLAFGIAATVSMVLVVGYLQKLLGGGRAKYEVAGLQLFYQVMFGLACLLRGDTGLTITVVAIATLGMAMRSTVDIDWDKTLARKE